MRAVHLFLITTVGLALLAAGILPPEHLHHSTATRSQIIHSHFESIPSSGPAVSTASHAEDDDHETAIGIQRVMAGGPTAPAAHPPALLPAPVVPCDSQVNVAMLASWEPDETPSPPPRPSAPRAPPA